ncbi:MAG: FkbM family methyltransferase [Nitrososphaerota archaeon]|nr:FkbM family methyltransferase [Nitrososphaerota archaeon]
MDEYERKSELLELSLGPFKMFVSKEEVYVYYATYVAGEYDSLHLTEGDIVLDAGANIGDFTIMAAKKVGHGGRVISIEPSSRFFSILKKNVLLNHLDNVSLVEAALSDTIGFAFLEGDGVSAKTVTASDMVAQRVRVTTIEEVMKELDLTRIDIIKMDIEGSEYKALHGLAFLNNVREIVIELHGPDNISTVRRLLEETGFDLIDFSLLNLFSRALKNVLFHLPSILNAERITGFVALRGVIDIIFKKRNPVPSLARKEEIQIVYGCRKKRSSWQNGSSIAFDRHE